MGLTYYGGVDDLNLEGVGGGAEKERRSNAAKHAGRDGKNELLEEWPCRDNKRSSKKPPSSIDVAEQHYSVPLRDKTGRRLRRNSTTRYGRNVLTGSLAISDTSVVFAPTFLQPFH